MVEIICLDSSYPYSYFEEVAHIHILEIHHSTLPLLGEKFLSRLYYELANSPKTGLWVAIERGTILGFIAGCSSTRDSYLSVIRRAGIPLGLLIIPSLMKLDICKKVLTLLAYPLYSPPIDATPLRASDKTEAELLAIAIHASAQRRGIGKMLVEAFEEGLVSWGITGNYCVATNLAEEKSNSFYQNIGFEPCYRQQHNDLILQVYQKRIEGKLN